MKNTRTRLFPIAQFILYLGLLLSGESKAQQDFNDLKSDILMAKTERARLEAIVTLSVTYNRNQLDSLYYYSEVLSDPDINDKEFAEAAKDLIEGVALYHQSRHAEAIDLLEISRKNFAELGSKNLQIRSMSFLGLAYNRSREHAQSANVFREVLKLTENDSEYTDARIAAFGNLSNAYRALGLFAEAIHSLERAIELSGDVRPETQQMSYFNLGQMLAQLELYDRALDALRLIDVENFPSESVQTAVYSNMARAFKQLNLSDSAHFYYQKALNKAQTTNNWQQALKPQIELGRIAMERQQFPLAETLLNNADDFYKQHRFPPPAYTDLLLAKMELYIASGQWQKGLQASKTFEQFINTNSIIHMSQNGFELVAQIHEGLGDTELALQYQKMYNDLGLAAKEAVQTNRLIEQRNQLALLDANERLEEESSSKEFYQGLTFQVIALSLILLTVLSIVYRYYHRVKKDNVVKSTELSQLKSQLEEAQSQTQEVEFISLKSKALIKLSDLRFVRSDGPYLEFHLTSKTKPEIDRNSLKSLMEELPNNFIQVHRSFIVNLNQVKSIYKSKLVLNDDTEISVSRSFKDDIDELLRNTA